MIKNYFIIITVLLSFNFLFSQGVGINTAHPSSKLDIKSTNTGMPTLQIDPQVNPSGVNDGDLSVIGDKLYLYYKERAKWLSVESSLYNFGENGNSELELEYSGDITRTGAIIPLDATIVSININAAGGTANKGIRLKINGITVPDDDLNPSTDGVLNMIGLTYANADYNLDINKGDILTVELENTTGTIEDIQIELILKWR